MRAWAWGLAWGLVWVLAWVLAWSGPALAGKQDDLLAAAVQDAASPTAANIFRNLTPINKYNPSLVWNGTPGDPGVGVLMVAWTGTWYDGSVGKTYDLSTAAGGNPVNLWLTAYPDLKNHFRDRRYYPDSIDMRLRQLLGLRTADANTRVVEMWVDPVNLIRPSADPEISDSEAELDFPTGLSRFLLFNATRMIRSNEGGVTKRRTFVEWYTDRTSTIYTGATPYPWTRLGYTYDWNNTHAAAGHVGLSEFFLVGNCSVRIRSTTATADYCLRPSSGYGEGQGCLFNPGAGIGLEELAGLGVVLALAGGMAVLGRRGRKRR
jgi:hypothetical protein